MASIVALEDAYNKEYFAQLGSQNIAVESGSVALTKLECTKVPYDSVVNEELYAKTIPVDWERCYKERDVIRTDSEENVAIPKS